MKRFLLYLLTGLLTLNMWAEPITQEQAQQLAEQFLAKKGGSRRLAPVKNRAKLAPAQQNATSADAPYYVFNRGESNGFIIVSGDTRAAEVLGYCDEGEFDYTNLPDNMRSWLSSYEQQIETLRATNATAPSRVPTHPAIAELLTCTWNQGYPYNKNCPNYFGQGTSMTGCVATAMAQLMYYQRSKSTDRVLADIPAYDTRTVHEQFGRLHVNGIAEGAPIDWDNMRDSYPGTESAASREAVANLMLYCGVSVEMDYTNNSSGAYSNMVADALKKYFGYGSSVQYIFQSSYSNDDWDALLYNELAEGRPFYLSGYNSEGGHAFVCDGYDGNRYYHINWGWGGNSNGYYLLTNLAPNSQGIGGTSSGDGYNDGVDAIIGIEPENFVDKAISFVDTKVKALCVANWDTDNNGNLSYGEAAAITDLGTVFQGSTIKTFNELRNFTSLTVISDDAFNDCKSMSVLTLPNGVTSIGKRAFNGCRALKSLILPKGLTAIGDSAFTGCRVLGDLILPQGITRIDAGTFENCIAFTSLELPAGLTALGSRALAGCTKLETLQVHASDPATITLGTSVFEGLKFTVATLIVEQGGKARFSQADQWKDFASIKERRTEEGQSTEVYQASLVLENLLLLAKAKGLNTSFEEAVFDDMNSTYEDLRNAQRSLRKKLKFIDFEDTVARNTFLAHYDLDGDGEISMTEGSMVSSLDYSFYRSNVTSLNELQYCTNLTTLYGNSFEGCSSLKSIILPESITTMYYRAFMGCTSLTEINLPEYISYIGASAFQSCTSLKTVRLSNPEPSSIFIDATAFSGVNTAGATLYVPFGTKEKYAQAAVWKKFGTIKEFRTHVVPKFSPLEEDAIVYIYHVGERRYLNKGEAWGTQAVVGAKGMKYQVKRSTSMPEGTYYLYSTETGKDGKVLFRTDTDNTVGDGVKACFVDGTLSERAYWTVTAQDDQLYTFQALPTTADDKVENLYLGVKTDHTSQYTYPTFGAYWDLTYTAGEKTCLWAFVSAEDYTATANFNNTIETLKHYLDIATQQAIDTTAEQAVYDNPAATQEEMEAAILSLKKKLHLIIFDDSRTQRICVNAWDTDLDDELSLEEAAAVTDIGETFRSTNIRTFDELRHFTSLTSIPENAFRSCSSLLSIYVPASVTEIGQRAFSSCSGLKYVAILNEAAPIEGSTASLAATAVTLFVPQSQLEAYQNDTYWSRFTAKPYTGIPTVTAQDVTREYGRNTTTFTYSVDGAPINGTPTLRCEAVPASDVGDYAITIEPGTITNNGLVCVDGTLSVTPATLTITAKNYTRNVGEENPEFELTYRTFKNDDSEEVLTTLPIIECDATADSPAGTYEIRVSGAEAKNYTFTYVNGTLTVVAPAGVNAPTLSTEDTQPVYDLQGRKVSEGRTSNQALRPGVYIQGGQKVLIR